MKTNNKNIIFFDGTCGLCHFCVKFIIERDTNRVFSFVSLQSPLAKDLLPKDFETGESVVVLEQGIMYTESAAAFVVLRQLRTFWRWLLVFNLLPQSVLDFLYRIIAKHRYRFFGRKTSCQIVSEKNTDRFL